MMDNTADAAEESLEPTDLAGEYPNKLAEPLQGVHVCLCLLPSQQGKLICMTCTAPCAASGSCCMLL